MRDVFKLVSEVVEETTEGRKAREAIDKVVNDALMKHSETHMTIYGFPTEGCVEVFNEIIGQGFYNGKTVTYRTPLGTITFNAKVSAPND